MTSSPTSPANQEQAKPQAAPAAKKWSRETMIIGLVVFGILSGIGGFFYWLHEQKFVYTDKAEISAPLIQLAPQGAGILKNVTVRQGDNLYASETVARVGDEMIQTQVSGIAVTVQQDMGAAYRSGQAIVTMIEPKELRVVARVAEDKGLKDVFVGQKAIFTVDAFGSTQFEGTVESVSATSREGDVVFNISDKREEKEFEVKIKYDVSEHPEFQNGMSARVWIIK